MGWTAAGGVDGDEDTTAGAAERRGEGGDRLQGG